MVAHAPDWVNRGSGAFSKNDGKVFYGVGVVTGVANPALEKDTADNRARYEIARVLNTYVEALYKDYLASSAASGAQGGEQQLVEQALKTSVNQTVMGAKVVDHWRNPNNNALYALATLSLEDYKALVANIKELRPELKGAVATGADRAFQQLEQGGTAK
jgi:hypothetical protein